MSNQKKGEGEERAVPDPYNSVSGSSCFRQRNSSHQETPSDVHTESMSKTKFSPSLRVVKGASYFPIAATAYKILTNKCTDSSKGHFPVIVNGYFIFAFGGPFKLKRKFWMKPV